MDRLVLEKEAEVETKIENTQTEQQKDEIELKQEEVSKTKYLSSLENMTIADFKRKEEDAKLKSFEKEKEVLIAMQYEPQTEIKKEKQVFQNVIEKPNYDLIEENKKVVKFKSTQKLKKKPSKKAASIAIACALAFTAGIAVANCVIIENMNSSYIQIDETYQLNLASYLRNISNLDQAQKGMEFIETYPEEMLDAGDTGKKSNWFDRLCNFIAGIFGG